MGRKSIKDNKNIFQTLREEAGLTRAKAQELLEFMSDDRIEKIESDKLLPRPEEVLKMQEVYKHPELSNYYCSHMCPIGQKYVPEVSVKELSQITVEVLDSLNDLEKLKNRLIEISVDGKITNDEIDDFKTIQNELNEMSKTIDSLTIWVENAINNGNYQNKK